MRENNDKVMGGLRGVDKEVRKQMKRRKTGTDWLDKIDRVILGSTGSQKESKMDDKDRLGYFFQLSYQSDLVLCLKRSHNTVG